MMDNAQLLSLLAPLYEPELAVSRWPAPGFWLLLLLVLMLLGWAGYLAWRHWQRLKPRREAINALSQLQVNTDNHVTELNLLLKRLLKAYAPAHPMLSASTAQWQAYWQRLLPAHIPLPPLDSLLYQAPAQQDPTAVAQFRLAVSYLIPRLDPASCQAEQHGNTLGANDA